MDHDYIEQFDFVDRYLMGKLSADESERFEEHFLDCPQCIDRLKATGDFIEGLRSVAVEEVSQAKDSGRRKTQRQFLNMRSVKLAALAALALLTVAVAVIAMLMSRVGILQSEIDQAKGETARLERRFEQQAESLPASSPQERERELTERIRDLEARLESEQSNRAGESGSGKQPRINLPILILNSVTRSDPTRAEPANEIILSRSATSFVIALALEDETRYRDYQASILSANNRVVWKGRGLRPNRYDSLTIEFDSSLFETGNYNVTVEGVTAEGDLRIVGSYPLRIVKKF